MKIKILINLFKKDREIKNEAMQRKECWNTNKNSLGNKNIADFGNSKNIYYKKEEEKDKKKIFKNRTNFIKRASRKLFKQKTTKSKIKIIKKGVTQVFTGWTNFDIKWLNEKK